jgi:chloramphenicol 3-O-phosphotransferase
VSMWERRPHSRAMARDMTVVEAPVSTQARRRLRRGGREGGREGGWV